MKVVFAADHAGFELKEVLKPFVHELGYEVVDIGAHELIPEDDYPRYCAPAARLVGENPREARGIVIGGSGQGEAMVANRVRGVRAAVYYGICDGARDKGLDVVSLVREHNDANILSLGARFLSVDEARNAVACWLATPFSNDERHVRRIACIDQA